MDARKPEAEALYLTKKGGACPLWTPESSEAEVAVTNSGQYSKKI